VEGRVVITADRLAERLRGLDSIGVGSGGVNRLAWSEEDAACRAWFAEQARSVGLRVGTDPGGNLWACPGAEPPWWGVGSHLDSVRDGGRFDGPLGVACGFEIAARVARPVAVISFGDEEGARWGTPTFGSRALVRRLPDVLDRRDDGGVRLGDALAGAGVDPARLSEAPRWLDRLRGFVEVHIDQTTELARAGAPVGVVRGLVDRIRLHVELRGRADHAGTTPRAERRDALAAAARLMIAAEEAADGVVVTTARIIAEPNAQTTIAARVRLWIDGRSPSAADLERWHERLRVHASELSERTGVTIKLSVASRSPGRELNPELRARLAEVARAVTGRPSPEVLSYAGHDAGVIAERLPAAMVFVRNPTGVSHAPDENVDLAEGPGGARGGSAALGWG
jgi:N-carbamoyl-L-amino-acid hydrolase